MNKIATFMLTLCFSILAIAAGLVVGGVSSYLVVRVVVLMLGPIFWEGGEGFLPIFATFLGGIVGGLSAVVCALPVADRVSLKKVYFGLCLGAGLSLAYGLWVISHGSFTSPQAPKGMSFWTVVVLVIAGGLAGMIGALIANADKWRFSVRSLLMFMTLVAVILGLIVLLP